MMSPFMLMARFQNFTEMLLSLPCTKIAKMVLLHCKMATRVKIEKNVFEEILSQASGLISK